MILSKHNILFLIMLWCCSLNSAAQDDYLSTINKISQSISPNKSIKKSKIRKKSKKKIPENNIIETITLPDTLDIYDIDINLDLGIVSMDTDWGDPVDNPRIRDDRASNLFGPIRHNPNGSIRWHRGFDYYAPEGTSIHSVGSGTVSLVQKHPDFGLCVLVTHKRPSKVYYSFYAHLSSIAVSYGQHVLKGTIIGKSGKTGNAWNVGAHLHFEYRTSPKHGEKKQQNPNAIVKTKFYSADPQNKYQYNVKVVKKEQFGLVHDDLFINTDFIKEH